MTARQRQLAHAVGRVIEVEQKMACGQVDGEPGQFQRLAARGLLPLETTSVPESVRWARRTVPDARSETCDQSTWNDTVSPARTGRGSSNAAPLSDRSVSTPMPSIPATRQRTGNAACARGVRR